MSGRGTKRRREEDEVGSGDTTSNNVKMEFREQRTLHPSAPHLREKRSNYFAQLFQQQKPSRSRRRTRKGGRSRRRRRLR